MQQGALPSLAQPTFPLCVVCLCLIVYWRVISKFNAFVHKTSIISIITLKAVFNVFQVHNYSHGCGYIIVVICAWSGTIDVVKHALVFRFRLQQASRGRPQDFFQKGAKQSDMAKMAYFSSRRKQFCDFFLCFRLSLRICDVNAEGASENFRVFCTETAYDIEIFKSRGG